MVHLLKKQGLVPKRIIADKLRSYGAARRQVMPGLATIRLDLLSRPKPFRSRQIRSPRCPDPILPPSRDYPMQDGRAATRLKSTFRLPCARTSKNVTVPSMVVIRNHEEWTSEAYPHRDRSNLQRVLMDRLHHQISLRRSTLYIFCSTQEKFMAARSQSAAETEAKVALNRNKLVLEQAKAVGLLGAACWRAGGAPLSTGQSAQRRGT